MIKLGETSLLLLICMPMNYFKWTTDVHKTLRDACVYEHVITGLLVGMLCGFLSKWLNYMWVPFLLAAFWHIIVKEVFLDWKKNHRTPDNIKYFKADMLQRTYGFLIGLPFLLIGMFL